MSAKFVSLSAFYSLGISPSKIHQLHHLLAKSAFGPIHSLLLYRGNTLFYEAYFENYAAQDLHEAQSVSKSLMSMALGLAVSQGILPSLDIPIYPYLSAYHHLDWEHGKKDITLRHLLTMTSGIRWNESKVPYADTQLNDSNRMAQSYDWLEYILSSPMESPPGKVFNYSSASPILLNPILEALSGLSTESFLKKYLFEPLAIEQYGFFRNPANPEILGDAFLMPRDLLKLGALMLHQGTLNGKQVLPKPWVVSSTRAHLKEVMSGEDYGFWWWRRAFPSSRATFAGYYAWGYGGQHIFIIPSLELLMVCTAGLYQQDRANEPFLLLEKYILEAIL